MLANLSKLKSIEMEVLDINTDFAGEETDLGCTPGMHSGAKATVDTVTQETAALAVGRLQRPGLLKGV